MFRNILGAAALLALAVADVVAVLGAAAKGSHGAASETHLNLEA